MFLACILNMKHPYFIVLGVKYSMFHVYSKPYSAFKAAH